MILDGYLMEKAKKYCKVMGIPFSRDRFSSKNTKELKDFINYQLKNDRSRTRRKEYGNKLLIKSSLGNLVSGLKVESPIEEYLRDALLINGFEGLFQTQHQIGKYRVDFAFPENKLVVECDGQEYHFSDRMQIERDQKRDKYLARKKWKVLHIEGLAIRRNIDLCIEKIKEALGSPKHFADLNIREARRLKNEPSILGDILTKIKEEV